ncbi:MAG: PhzF family phenazine biosynthesis protein [Candidatus Caenarcaniphilales bacterium]|nr:PhzF family phenazine biosynthesis protein [Candidatus Caenarcaniphilales bacterium]
MKIPIYQIDNFTDKVFGGNPAAVCPLEQWLPSDLMQKIAAENNLSETAFFVKEGSSYRIRWFTPTQEIDLCGHATLAAGFVIFTFLNPSLKEVTFQSQSGPLHVLKQEQFLFLDFPSREGKPVEPPEALIVGLGKKPLETFLSRDYLVIYSSEAEVKELKPDFRALAEIKDCLGIIASAPGGNCDFVSRFFAPNAGVDEDPVTGSAHCTLIPYWSKRLNKKQLSAQQVSLRGGNLVCEDLSERLKIGGSCICYLRGEIEV